MSKTVAVLMAPGFEDAETIVTIDVLRRLKLQVEILACQDALEVLSYFKRRRPAERTRKHPL